MLTYDHVCKYIIRDQFQNKNNIFVVFEKLKRDKKDATSVEISYANNGLFCNELQKIVLKIEFVIFRTEFFRKINLWFSFFLLLVRS